MRQDPWSRIRRVGEGRRSQGRTVSVRVHRRRGADVQLLIGGGLGTLSVATSGYRDLQPIRRRSWRKRMGQKARVDLVLDCADPAKLADFWRAALDYRDYYAD